MFDPVLQKLRDLNTAGLLLSGDREEGPLVGGARPSRQPVGRGQLVRRRGGSVLVQTALVPEPRWDADDADKADDAKDADEAATVTNTNETVGVGAGKD